MTLDDQDKTEVKKLIEDTLTGSFFRKRIGDTPLDNLQLTPRRYVNLNGTIANRPASLMAILGQQYFATDLNKPVFFDGTQWRDGSSSIIASN